MDAEQKEPDTLTHKINMFCTTPVYNSDTGKN